MAGLINRWAIETDTGLYVTRAVPIRRNGSVIATSADVTKVKKDAKRFKTEAEAKAWVQTHIPNNLYYYWIGVVELKQEG